VQATQAANDELYRLERVAHDRRGLWTSIAFELIGLLLFVGIFNFIFPNLGANLNGPPMILLGMLFGLAPAGLWLIFFYRMDRLEPEPKQQVFSVFLAGALVAAALHNAILQGVFDVNGWLYNAWWTRLAGGILVVGFVEQFIVYATVRYVMFHHPEFDERVDGVIYGVAAGLGLATVLNFLYVIESHGVDLDIGSIRMVVNTLAHASFAGVLGYFIGQGRFEKVPFYYLPMGLTIAAALNGLFFFLLDRTAGSGFNYNPWGDLIFAAIVAVITLGVVFWLVARANEETLRLAHQTAWSSGQREMAGVPQEIASEVADDVSGSDDDSRPLTGGENSDKEEDV
jgi:RsiW-degrading membrane proteinase PrsW (M82 family)